MSAAPIPQTHEHVHNVWNFGSSDDDNDRVLLTIYPEELK